jgi:Zn-dependent protease
MTDLVIYFLLSAIPVVLAITLHEVAHGYSARLLGDPTAYQMGRITLNPLKHIDPMGTILLPAMLIASNAMLGSSLPIFGWAKPVPVNFGRLRNPKADMLWVAAAGPAANLLQAFVWTLVFAIAIRLELGGAALDWLRIACSAGVMTNLALMLLNLVPIPPLDGGRIAVSLLPYSLAVPFSRIEPYGFVLLFALLWLKVLDDPLKYGLQFFVNLLGSIINTFI